MYLVGWRHRLIGLVECGYDMILVWFDWEDALTAMYNFYEASFSELPEIEFDIKQHFKTNSEDIFVEHDTDDKITFGGMSWHTSESILYISDYGGDYNSIWQIDLDKNQTKKIIPENKAIHPFFFKINDKEYIAYVEKNMIMISESPNNIKTGGNIYTSQQDTVSYTN